MAIGLPSIDITFKKLAATLIARSARGVVALIIKDDTDATYALKEYRSASSVEAIKYTAQNIKYIKDVFTGVTGVGGASRVLVVPVAVDSEDAVTEAVGRLGSRKYNWIGLAAGTPEEQTALAAYIKEQRNAKKGFKCVAFNVTNPDSTHVVNFVNPTITFTSGETVTGDSFVPRLLGLLAGLPLTRSSTYVVFDDVASVEEPSDLEAAVNAGKFVLFNDEETVRVARGVNSLVTLFNTVTDDFKKIVIVETMDLIREDISTTFKNDFLGRYKNKYDNQVLLITAINAYFDTLASEDLLDNTFSNRADVDVESQRAAWIAFGKTQAEEWDDQTVKNNSFGSKVFLGGNIKITDAMEDMQFDIELE
ncbi:phage tail sheath C-terminal domain-containing protein [Paenibacillus taichungensis]|uniref:phage tail sheath C-terminal domain-containing protein n=1 Tax=Paenibacillus taichungensis TaxID=484184 RepID=UPI002DBBA5D5|nr:phage tail sheath C-terminal domain-containing protein [Paenibacillus taichungensis]MEC0107269.1 phage tail sheath C-terminal domain-containing protein [Paenibacillus taichungensis]MEC0194799.1 phage tail sheath C-terminal domain-containing protein [Paenibacillus taichungensis]